MIKKRLMKRLHKIVGPVPEGCLVQIDSNQWVMKPNTYSKKGIMISGDMIDSCSYGGLSSFPVAIGYGLDEEQSEKVLSQCLQMCEEVNICLAEGAKEDAQHLCKSILKDVCVVLTSCKRSEDQTLTDLIRRMPEKTQSMYYKVMDCLKKVPEINCNQILAEKCHKMSMQSGSLSRKHLQENKLKLLEDMRDSYIPFMGDSTLEQDHWGMKKIDDDSLFGSSEEFSKKRSVVSFSSIHVGGVDTLTERLGIDLPKSDTQRKISPVKKKEGFEKSVAIVDALGRVDDPRLESGLKKLWSRMNIEKDGVSWDRVIAVDPDKMPIIVPVIVAEEDKFFSSDYSPIQALEVLDSLTDVTDYSGVIGSGNIQIEKRFDKSVLDTLSKEFPDDKFPMGGQSPFSPPRRVNKEVL